MRTGAVPSAWKACDRPTCQCEARSADAIPRQMSRPLFVRLVGRSRSATALPAGLMTNAEKRRRTAESRGAENQIASRPARQLGACQLPPSRGHPCRFTSSRGSSCRLKPRLCLWVEAPAVPVVAPGRSQGRSAARDCRQIR
jgi:hypothetical protein